MAPRRGLVCLKGNHLPIVGDKPFLVADNHAFVHGLPLSIGYLQGIDRQEGVDNLTLGFHRSRTHKGAINADALASQKDKSRRTGRRPR